MVTGSLGHLLGPFRFGIRRRARNPIVLDEAFPYVMNELDAPRPLSSEARFSSQRLPLEAMEDDLQT